MCTAGPCECGDPAKYPYGSQWPVHTICDHDRCLEIARQLIAEPDPLSGVDQDANGYVTIVECMLLGGGLVPHARQVVATVSP
jgi:hypothetical protein